MFSVRLGPGPPARIEQMHVDLVKMYSPYRKNVLQCILGYALRSGDGASIFVNSK